MSSYFTLIIFRNSDHSTNPVRTKKFIKMELEAKDMAAVYFQENKKRRETGEDIVTLKL